MHVFHASMLIILFSENSYLLYRYKAYELSYKFLYLHACLWWLLVDTIAIYHWCKAYEMLILTSLWYWQTQEPLPPPWAGQASILSTALPQQESREGLSPPDQISLLKQIWLAAVSTPRTFWLCGGSSFSSIAHSLLVLLQLISYIQYNAPHCTQKGAWY